MAKFTSKYRALTLQDADGVWAQFEPSEDKSCGVFETSSAKIAARLREVEDVEEVDEPAAEKPLEKRTVDELRKYAADNQIDLGEASKKDEILAAIAAAQQD